MIDAAIRAVYFDAVGTLLFPRQAVGATYADFAARHGIAVDESCFSVAFREAFMRQELLDSRNNWRTDETRERTRWRAIVAELIPGAGSTQCFDELWNWYGRPQAWRVNPESAEVFIELTRRGLVVGMASNFDSRLNVLVGAIPDLAQLRERCVVSSLIGWRKPAREFYMAVAQNAGCSPAQVLYVGDDLRNDIHGATSAGLKAILFDPDDRADVGPRIRSLRDLLTA